jgi:thymidylate kinase
VFKANRKLNFGDSGIQMILETLQEILDDSPDSQIFIDDPIDSIQRRIEKRRQVLSRLLESGVSE